MHKQPRGCGKESASLLRKSAGYRVMESIDEVGGVNECEELINSPLMA